MLDCKHSINKNHHVNQNSKYSYLDWNIDRDRENIRTSALQLRMKDAMHTYIHCFSTPDKANSFLLSPRTFWRRKAIDKFELFLNDNLHGNIIEIGAGTGWCSAILSMKDTIDSVFTMDYSKYCIENLIPQAHKAIGANTSKITRVLGSYNKMQCNADEFDFIISIGAIHHSENLQATMKECQRVLKPGGYMLALEPCEYNTFTIEEQIAQANKLISGDAIKSKYGENISHIRNKDDSDHSYRLCEYEAFAIRANLNPITFLFDTMTYVYPPHYGDKLFFKNKNNGFIPNVSYPYFAKNNSATGEPVFDKLMLILHKPLNDHIHN